MAVQWGLHDTGFNAMEALQVYGRSAQQTAQQQAARQDQETRQAALGQYQRGDQRGAQMTAMGGGMDDLAAHLGKLDDNGRKEAADQMKQLGELALMADTPEKWDAYAMQYAQQGHPEAMQFVGKFSPAARAVLIAQAGKANEFIAQNEPKYMAGGEYGVVNVRDPNAVRAYNAAAEGGAPSQAPAGGGGLEAQAAAAIAAGADPAAVRARMAQMSGGAPSQGGATFP
jgi:hypothetical protein